jgi:hypothetical protein
MLRRCSLSGGKLQAARQRFRKPGVALPTTRHLIATFAHFIVLVRHLVADFAGLATSWYRSRGAPTAENLFLFAIHDRDRIYSKDLDQAVEAMSVRVLRTPVRAPKGNCSK